MQGARHRLRLGRAGALSATASPTSRCSASPCPRSSSRSPGERAAAAGVADRVKFELIDYRDVDRPLRPDRLGRHVRACRPAAFPHLLPQDAASCCRRRRRCCSTRSAGWAGPGTTDRFMQKYIFPGGYLPALSETVAASEQERLIMADCETLRLPLSSTRSAHWYDRVEAQRDEIVAPATTSASTGSGCSTSPASMTMFTRRRHGRLPDPISAAPRRAADHPRLYVRGRGAAARPCARADLTLTGKRACFSAATTEGDREVCGCSTRCSARSSRRASSSSPTMTARSIATARRIRPIRPVHARLTDKGAAFHIAKDPRVGAGEAYMDGRLVIEPPATSATSSCSSATMRRAEKRGRAQAQGAAAQGVDHLGRPARPDQLEDAARAATPSTPTTSPGGSTSSSSTRTGNIPAPIIATRRTASSRPSSTRRRTSPPSCT